jgi:hypothetical protein
MSSYSLLFTLVSFVIISVNTSFNGSFVSPSDKLDFIKLFVLHVPYRGNRTLLQLVALIQMQYSLTDHPVKSCAHLLVTQRRFLSIYF